MTARRSLPNRRNAEIVQFEHGGIVYRAGIGRFSDGSLAEVFLDGGKVGSAVEAHARDAAILLSLSLQHGCPLDVIRHALVKLSNGRGAGPIAHLLDRLEAASGGR